MEEVGKDLAEALAKAAREGKTAEDIHNDFLASREIRREMRKRKKLQTEDTQHE